ADPHSARRDRAVPSDRRNARLHPPALFLSRLAARPVRRDRRPGDRAFRAHGPQSRPGGPRVLVWLEHSPEIPDLERNDLGAGCRRRLGLAGCLSISEQTLTRSRPGLGWTPTRLA